MSTFNVNRTLLNPRFDGYKFSPLDVDEVTLHYPLENRLSQTNVSGRAPLSFQEVQSRVSHNHLAVCSQSRRAVYVDAELRVIGIDIDEATLRAVFRTVFELPRPVHSNATETLQREYPSAQFLDQTSLFVSDGYGSLYVLRINEIGAAELLATYELSIPPTYGSSYASVPFRLHHATAPNDNSAVLILSSKHYPKDAPQATKTSKPPSVKFDIWAVQIALPITPSPAVSPLPILAHRRGADVPTYTAYDASRHAFLLVGGAAYLPATLSPAPQYEPAPDELAPIPRAGEDLDGSAGLAAAEAPSMPKPPPYSWTQTSDSVTLAIPLPSATPTSHIKVAFSPRTLTVLVERPAVAASTTATAAAAAAETEDVPIVAPRYTLRALWDGIQPGTSLWTFDRAAESRYGLLTLHLDKQHEGTRWPQVFASTPGSGSGADDDANVPETIDPSELYNIREALEKYTAALNGGDGSGGGGGLGLGAGVPSLAEGELDDELDLSVGKSVYATWVVARTDGAEALDALVDDAPLQLLSTPFSGAADTLKISLVTKHGLDGVTFTLQEAAAPGSDATGNALPVWEHTSTYSALSFVLASKRDTRFVHHVASRAVFAFESGAQDLGGNVYIYRGTDHKENWAKQAVLKIGGGGAGSLLGVGLMNIHGKIVILCLCEGELTVLHGVV